MKPHLRLVKSTQSTPSSVKHLHDACSKCGFYVSPDGCACSYILKLAPGGEHEALRERALRMFKIEHITTTDCPCPTCYMSRCWSWFEDQRPDQLRKVSR